MTHVLSFFLKTKIKKLLIVDPCFEFFSPGMETNLVNISYIYKNITDELLTWDLNSKPILQEY